MTSTDKILKWPRNDSSCLFDKDDLPKLILQATGRTLQTAQHCPKRLVPFEVPLAAHGLPPAFISLSIQKNPASAARRFRARAVIMAPQALIKINGPTDIGLVAGSARAPQDIDIAGHAYPSPYRRSTDFATATPVAKLACSR